ncbi:MAG: hypothetical protein HY293_20850 [Planctomycetes bacterium]|nr:hypothetical protein [Planctomycetota bacterium]
MMRRLACLVLLVCGCAAPEIKQKPPLGISWEKNMLTVSGPFPGGKIETWYLEAFCRAGARDRVWKETTIPHTTEKISDNGQTIRLLTKVEGGVEVTSDISAGFGEIEFRVEAVNKGKAYVDAQWVQPCVRVGPFTGCDQKSYVSRSFIFVNGKRTFLDQARRTEEAIYKGGQLYIPPGINRADCNPRPHSPDVPSNRLIGCVSANNEWLWATAWEPTQELFQGVIICLHNDFRLGGLNPGETKRARGKMYIMENDVELLLGRYSKDFSR